MTTTKDKDRMSGKIKEFLHPTLMYIIGAIMCFEVTSIQTDVKSLLAQTNVDKTEIANLKRQVDDLNSVVFMSKYKASTDAVQKGTDYVLTSLQPDRLFKHEEEYDIKKFIPRRI